METLASLIQRTIRQGAVLYNDGKIEKCFEVYMGAAKHACEQERIALSSTGSLLEAAADEAMELSQKGDFKEGAWVLRYCFDKILEEENRGGQETDIPMVPETTTTTEIPNVDDSIEYWQDEKVRTQNDLEDGQCIADIFKIIQGYLPPQSYKYGFTTYEDCIRGGDAVELISSLALVPSRQVAEMKMDMFQQGGFILAISHNNEKPFRGGNHLYKYGDANSMREAKKKLNKNGPYASGTGEAALEIALEITLSEDGHSVKKKLSRALPRVGKSRRVGFSDVENDGVELATLSANLEKTVEMKDRKWGIRPKVYEDCFVGNEAISTAVEMGWAASRQDATNKLNKALEAGLIYHVTREHSFEDKNLFYAFSSAKEIKASLDANESLTGEPSPSQLLQTSALKERYRQFSGLDIEDILNRFYGCKTKDGWDTLDLQNWRNNMKRWGFGRREDQDDEMVDYLAPLISNVDPETWDKTGDEDWESPWGILAQIAIFDQIPRSAFRGKADAFKWDDLAIRATKVAIEKGYFDTAYKSTLNRFVILLPLEHSESWEDQKLGVKLLLQMLSSVAIEDEEDGHSPYEIVKRLEFSKRLSTAFLEHAQVVAKFKRYPHRNRQHGRTTTLEERIWLASDLVPRWARSQNEEGPKGKTVVTLPVIPLKKLTRGR